MSVEDTVKALRAISQDYENGNGGECFDICGECNIAADQLEQLQAENVRLKAEKPVRCGECKYWRKERHNIGVCIYKSIYLDRCNEEFCSSGKRRDAE